MDNNRLMDETVVPEGRRDKRQRKAVSAINAIRSLLGKEGRIELRDGEMVCVPESIIEGERVL